MDIFVARQPILTNVEDIFGYELLYRNSQENSFTQIDGDLATIELLLNSFIGIGNQELSSGKKLFINFTRNLLLKRVPCLFPPETFVIEVLEDVAGDQEVIAAITEFKKLGYSIALDDFILKEMNKDLIPLADIIKVDFLQTSIVQRKIIGNLARNYNVKLLAEKIETRVAYQKALKEDYDFFQGYFFSKPIIISSRDIPFYSNEYMSILNELTKPEPDLNKITTMIACDLSLSYHILKIVNTLAYYTRVKITSIKQAVLILGLDELMKLITIISLKKHQTSSSVSKEIFFRSLVRAKIAEQLGGVFYGNEKKSECFMLGMFSLLDTILQRPMEQVLEVLPLSNDVKHALLGSSSSYESLLDLIIAVEKGDWGKLQNYSKAVAPINISTCNEDAIKWACELHHYLREDVKAPNKFI